MGVLKISKFLGPKALVAGVTGLVLVGALAFGAYQPTAPKVAAGPNAPTHPNSKSTAKADIAQVLGASTTRPASSPSTSPGAPVVVVPASNNSSQPVNIIVNDPPVDPPPPVICHIYDACGAQPADQQQGIYGTITRGPITPLCRAEVPCDGPYQTTIIVSNSQGQVTWFTSGSDGSFRVDLLPGTYTLTPASADRFPWASTTTVTVVSGLYSQVDISFDTGIR